jgi:hypothetical protein
MSNVLKMPKRDAKWAETEVRRIVAISEGNIIFTDHALERMDLRGFFRKDVMNALKNGYVTEQPEPVKDGMKCKVVRRLNVGRECGVVTVIKKSEKLIIVTVEWEDLS